MTAATVWLAIGGYYAAAVVYFLAVGLRYPKANGAGIMIEAGIWPYWTIRRIGWAIFGPPKDR